jgi:hypothetical protein
MVDQTPRPAALSEPNRAGNTEGFGDAFNSPDSSVDGLHQGIPATSRGGAGGKGGATRQYLVGPHEFDIALERLLPKTSADVRHVLRKPFEQLIRGASTYLNSPRGAADDNRFADVTLYALAQTPAKWRPHVRTMLIAFRRETNRALPHYGDCCHRSDLALVHVLEHLFAGSPQVGG